ncbi:GntR family transcriptional regulator [Clostridium sp. MCC353]|uniref:winged helix-turn-helix domain-containing protein n=1 Tax=Clostridium sp. MCC353 TaxID=2592646 RepID=UPI001C020A15|nr:GntR family transcriptional regulator [Clostridium sp. MCC353]MBT9779680.1 GntR family transcriptional regulator [Clostridium sp. MCC353]
MKSDLTLYERVYWNLKNKIESGLLPDGAKLPSRAELCREFGVSEKTVRCALDLLAENGLIKTRQRMRPVVVSSRGDGDKNIEHMLQKANQDSVNDIVQTGILLCYPFNARGLLLCHGREWEIPESILSQMNPDEPEKFWKLSNRFWRFFLARNGNELILRVAESMGFELINMNSGTLALRESYHASLWKLVETMKAGGDFNTVRFDDLYPLYGLEQKEHGRTACGVVPASSLPADAGGLEQRLYRNQERYSSVCLDLLGLIAIGRYQPGDRLPTHEQLQKIYGVSIDTTTKAVGMLQEWGVLSTKRGQGIFVEMCLEQLKTIKIEPEVISSHVRRFLDSMELVSLTVEGVAAHAAAYVGAEEARELRQELKRLWSGRYVHQMFPRVFLDFLTAHIQYAALKSIYNVIRKNYSVGRSIPKLVNLEKTAESRQIYRRCMAAVDALEAGSIQEFARITGAMFQFTHQLALAECKRLGYWENAMNVYDGDALWK